MSPSLRGSSLVLFSGFTFGRDVRRPLPGRVAKLGLNSRGCRPELLKAAPPGRSVFAPEEPALLARGGSPEDRKPNLGPPRRGRRKPSPKPLNSTKSPFGRVAESRPRLIS